LEELKRKETVGDEKRKLETERKKIEDEG